MHWLMWITAIMWQYHYWNNKIWQTIRHHTINTPLVDQRKSYESQATKRSKSMNNSIQWSQTPHSPYHTDGDYSITATIEHQRVESIAPCTFDIVIENDCQGESCTYCGDGETQHNESCDPGYSCKEDKTDCNPNIPQENCTCIFDTWTQDTYCTPPGGEIDQQDIPIKECTLQENTSCFELQTTYENIQDQEHRKDEITLTCNGNGVWMYDFHITQGQNNTNKQEAILLKKNHTAQHKEHHEHSPLKNALSYNHEITTQHSVSEKINSSTKTQ